MPAGHKQRERLVDHFALTGTGGSHGNVWLTTKLRKDGSKGTRFIQIQSGPQDSTEVAEYSAVVSEITRFISIGVNPKVRTITEAIPYLKRRRTVGVISGAIDGFQEAKKFLQSNPNYQFTQLQKKQLAEMLTGAYFTAENDLHYGNWGIDKNGNIKKIDNDQAFFDYTAVYKGLASASVSDEQLKNWPNRIYAPEDAFRITSEDIQNLPFLKNAHPLNWLNWSPNQQFNTLSRDPEFIKYKYLNLTKLLLISNAQINDCTAAHCSDPNLQNGLNNYLIDRRNSLYNALLLDPGYKNFLAHLKSNTGLMNELNTELINYNNQYVRNGNLKSKYNQRVFNVAAVPAALNNITNWMNQFSPIDIQQRKIAEAQSIKAVEISGLENLMRRQEFNSPYIRPYCVQLLNDLKNGMVVNQEAINYWSSLTTPIAKPILQRIMNRVNEVNTNIDKLQKELVAMTAQQLPLQPVPKVAPQVKPVADILPAQARSDSDKQTWFSKLKTWFASLFNATEKKVPQKDQRLLQMLQLFLLNQKMFQWSQFRQLNLKI